MTKNIDDVVGHSFAYDNLDSDGLPVKDYFPQYPVYMNLHLDVICVQGSFSFESGGQAHRCTAGTLTVIVKDSFCRFTDASDDCRIAVMTSDTSNLHMEASSLANLVLFRHYVLSSPTFKLTEEEMELVLGIYRLVKSISSKKRCKYGEEICKAQHVSLFYLLFGKVGSYLPEEKSGTQSRKSICRTFMSNVAEHFREERKLDFYAKLQCVSTKHLSFAVKKECGIQAHQIIADYVMIEAKSLLSRDDLSIMDISDMLHFQSQSFFGKYFKSHEGMSPYQYRCCIE